MNGIKRFAVTRRDKYIAFRKPRTIIALICLINTYTRVRVRVKLCVLLRRKTTHVKSFILRSRVLNFQLIVIKVNFVRM